MLLLDERRVEEWVDVVEPRRWMLPLPQDSMAVDIVKQSVKLMRHIGIASVVEEDVRPLPTFCRFRSGTDRLAVAARLRWRREGTQSTAV